MTLHRHAARARRPDRREAGSSFAELMLATLILGTTVVGATSSLQQSATVYHYFADGPHEALMLAQEIHEAAELLPWEADWDADPEFGPSITTLWDLDQASFSPPRSANYEIVSSHLHWKQIAEIEHVDMEAPTVVVDPDEFEGETLVRLTVTIEKGLNAFDDETGEQITKDMGEFIWWMTEPEEL